MFIALALLTLPFIALVVGPCVAYIPRRWRHRGGVVLLSIAGGVWFAGFLLTAVVNNLLGN